MEGFAASYKRDQVRSSDHFPPPFSPCALSRDIEVDKREGEGWDSCRVNRTRLAMSAVGGKKRRGGGGEKGK